jgi:hypothetical protein
VHTRGAAVIAAVVVVVAPAALAACGSSSKPLSKAEYIAKADVICQQTTKRFVDATKGLRHPSPAQVVDATRTKLVPLLQSQDKDLAKLDPPVADKAAVRKFLADLQAATDDIAKNTAAFVQARGVSRLATAASTEAGAYGFKVCAKTGPS